MENHWLLQYHEDLEACVARVLDEVRATWPCGCKLGNVDVSSVLLRYLWHRSFSKLPVVFNEDTCRRSITEVESALRTLISFKATPIENRLDNKGWYECLKGQENKILFFATSPRILNYLQPLIKALKDDFILLTEVAIPDGFEIPSNGTVIPLRMPKARLFRNAELEQALPWFYNFANAISWFIEILKPRLLICMDGCQSEYRLAAAFCNDKHIPSICLQLGWPSYIHTGFRDLPYTYFLTWGNKFNPLWEKYNRHPKFIAVGYMDEITKKGDHEAITFFLQAPIYLNTEKYLDRMCELVVATAKRYPSIPVLVREHPEYRGKTRGMALVSQCPNIYIANEDSLMDVYARTKVVVSHFSSVLMECLMYGCIPLVFNPTPGSSYNPDIEEEGIGFISKDEKSFFLKLPACLSHPPFGDLPEWFKATGKETLVHITDFVNKTLT